MKNGLIFIMSLVLILGLIGCASDGNKLADDQRLAAEAIVVRGVTRAICINNPAAIPVIKDTCAQGEGQSSDILSALIRDQIAKYSPEMAKVPGLEDNVKDLAELLGVSLAANTVPEVANVVNNDKLIKMFGAVCEGANQAEVYLGK